MMSEQAIQDIVNKWFGGRNAIDKADAVKLCAFVSDKTLGVVNAELRKSLSTKAT